MTNSGELRERWYTVEEVASRLRVKPYTVREWLRSGELRGVRLAGRWRISESDVAEFLERQRNRPGD